LDLAKSNNKNYNPKNQLFTVLQLFFPTPGHDRSSSHNEGSVSSHEAVAGSFTSEITVWGGGRHRISVDDDDFLPATASDRMYATRFQSDVYENARLAGNVERRLRELNIRAEHTYAQTQETALIMRQRGQRHDY